MPFQRTRRPSAAPPAPDTAAWRRIARALESGEDDAAIARRLRVGRGHVAHIRAAVAPEPAPPPPVECLADDVPAQTDAPPPCQLVIRANPTVTCWNCGREGTPSETRPMWCKACASSSEAASWRETQLWRCACDGPFARSTQQPDRCIRCSGEYDQAARRQRRSVQWPASAD